VPPSKQRTPVEPSIARPATRVDGIEVIWDEPDEARPGASGDEDRSPRRVRRASLWWSAIAARVERPLEMGLSAALLAVSTWFLVRMLREAWTVPLWTDELFSLEQYSNRGFWYSLTHYDSPNNHVLQNALTALVPGPDFATWRARLLPMGAIVGAQLLILLEFGRRRLLLGGAVVYSLFACNLVWLDSALQARGYAFVALATVVGALASWRYVEDGRRRWLVALAVATVFGAWAQPIFAVYSGALWLVLFLVVRRWWIAVFGGFATLGVLLAYLPILGPLREAERTFGDRFGLKFTDLNAVGDVFTTGMLNRQVTGIPMDVWAVFAVVLAVLVLPQVAPLSDVQRKTVFVLTAASALFLAVCLQRETPYFRAVVFVLIPFAIVGAILFTSWYRQPSAVPLRPVIAVTVAGLLIVNGWRQGSAVMPIPRDDFEGVAGLVATWMPDGTALSTGASPEYFEAYLDEDHPVVAFDAIRPPAGRWLYVDYEASGRPETDFASVAPIYAEARVPQRRGAYQRILVPRPATSPLAAMAIDGSYPAGGSALDDVPATMARATATGDGDTVELSALFHAGAAVRSLFIVVPPDRPIAATRGVVVGSDGERHVLREVDMQRIHSGIVVDLGDRRVQEMQLVIEPAGPFGSVAIEAAWAEPVVWPVTG
jgi:hypothetical protein